MPGKMAGSAPGHFGLPDAAAGRPHVAAALQEGQKYRTIHARSSAIWGIPFMFLDSQFQNWMGSREPGRRCADQ